MPDGPRTEGAQLQMRWQADTGEVMMMVQGELGVLGSPRLMDTQ